MTALIKCFRILLLFLIFISCSDSGYKKAMEFYKKHRNDFLKSDLVQQNFSERGFYYQIGKNDKLIYKVFVIDSCDIRVVGNLSYFNSIYKVFNDYLIKDDRIEFKLQNNGWIGFIDSSTILSHLNKTGLEYFLKLDKLRSRWGISLIFKCDSTITIQFYNKENELIYRGLKIIDKNTKSYKKLDSLWTYRKLEKVYE